MYIYILGVTQLKKLNNRLVGFYMNKMLEVSVRVFQFLALVYFWYLTGIDDIAGNDENKNHLI